MDDIKIVSPGPGDLILTALEVEEGRLRREYPEATIVSVSSLWNLAGRRVEDRIFASESAMASPAFEAARWLVSRKAAQHGGDPRIITM